MEFVLRPWRRMFDFGSRATRREYWGFFAIYYAVLMAIVLAIGMAAPADAYSTSPVASFLTIIFFLYGGIGFVAGLSVSVRRLHDHDKSGWFLLISLFPFFGWIFQLIMMLTPGTEGENEYGPDPRDPNAENEEVAEVFA